MDARRDAFILPHPRQGAVDSAAPSLSIRSDANATANAVATRITETEVAVMSSEHESVALNPMEATLQEFNKHITMALLAPPQLQSTAQPEIKLKPQKRPQLVQDEASREKRQRETAIAAQEETRPDRSSHILLPNLGRGRILCRLCSKRGLKTRTRYGCVQCRLGFHVECFAVFHQPNLFTDNPTDSIRDALDVIQHHSPSRPATRRRLNNSIRSIAELALPTVSDAQDD